MSCSFCKEEKVLLETEVANIGMLYWGVGQKITQEALEATEHDLIVHIDRGYLRLSNPEDNNCMDHGERIKIHFCPVCGDSLDYACTQESVEEYCGRTGESMKQDSLVYTVVAIDEFRSEYEVMRYRKAVNLAKMDDEIYVIKTNQGKIGEINE